jgi:hypothetical protein
MAPLVRKPNESKLAWYWRRGVNKVSFHLMQISDSQARRKLSKITQDMAGFCRWLSQSTSELVDLRKRPDRRLLAIYDLRSQPFSIGDILMIQAASLIVREQKQLNFVDFALLYDPAEPTSADPSFSPINSDNILYHLASVLPVAQVNPFHGSLFVFNSPLQLNRFIADNADRYHIWPSAWRFSLKSYHFHHVFNDLVHNHFRQHGSLPRLTSRPFLADWARSFFREHADPQVPVTVQIRRNQSICVARNLNLECWLDFFRHCEENYPAKFVVICARSEVDERLRDCRNVVIAKDHGTTIEQDLALIQTAAIHMGASSGPGMVAIFNTKPYLFVNCDTNKVGLDDLLAVDGMWQFSFATPYQRFAEPPETLDLLTTQFARMWSALDPGERPYDDNQAAELVSWLR